MWWVAGLWMGCAGTVPPTFAIPDLDTHHTTARPWTSLAAKDDPSRFHFAIVTDRTGGVRPGVFRVGVDKVNLLQPAFVMSVGDLIEGYTEDRAQIEAEWDAFDATVEELDAPFFYVPGNHDIMNAEMDAAWTARFGASYYHFLYKDVLFLVLNAELFDLSDIEGWSTDRTRGPGQPAWHASAPVRQRHQAQMAYARDVLAANPDVRWTFVFVHKPYWRPSFVYPPRDPATRAFVLDDYPVDGPWPTSLEVTEDWRRIAVMLGDRDYTAFAGHRHTYAYEDVGDATHTHEHISLATTGGASRLRGVSFGEFDHFLWVTMTEEGPVFANLLLDGVQPKAPATPDRRPWWVE
ncbi:MAG: metallophosphoesterase [Myxococcota bacterium]